MEGRDEPIARRVREALRIAREGQECAGTPRAVRTLNIRQMSLKQSLVNVTALDENDPLTKKESAFVEPAAAPATPELRTCTLDLEVVALSLYALIMLQSYPTLLYLHDLCA